MLSEQLGIECDQLLVSIFHDWLFKICQDFALSAYEEVIRYVENNVL